MVKTPFELVSETLLKNPGVGKYVRSKVYKFISSKTTKY